MNLKLKTWNESMEYANKVCKNLFEKGYNVKSKPYTMYDGRKGIHLQVLDNYENIYIEYSTGIHDNLVDMMDAIDRMSLRILNEC